MKLSKIAKDLNITVSKLIKIINKECESSISIPESLLKYKNVFDSNDTIDTDVDILNVDDYIGDEEVEDLL